MVSRLKAHDARTNKGAVFYAQDGYANKTARLHEYKNECRLTQKMQAFNPTNGLLKGIFEQGKFEVVASVAAGRCLLGSGV